MDTSPKTFICYSSKKEQMSHKRNPLEIPEIVRMVGRFVERSNEIAAMKVSEIFHSQVSATTWETIVVDLTNKALYRELPSEIDMYEEGPRLLPWKSLKSYGSHVRNITMASFYDPCPPPSYPRPASVTDLLTTLGELPFLKCMTLDISSVVPRDLPQLFEICSRLKSLDIRRLEMCRQGTASVSDISNRNWKSQASAHRSTYDLEELSFSPNCGIGLCGFLSRSPRLRVLSIYDKYRRGYDEEQRLNELMKSFRTEGSMPSLQHLDLCIYGANNDTISKVLRSVRCLRGFKCDRRDALLSIPDFRAHFSTITTIKVQSGTPEFWQEIMSSCPALVKAKYVVISAEDIIGGRMWLTTRLESLDLNVYVRSQGDERSRSEEKALFRRIAKLVKLNDLSVHTGWHEARTLREQSLETLLTMETLTSVELGRELTARLDVRNTLRRFSERQMELKFTQSRMPLSPGEDDDATHALLLQAFGVHPDANQN